MIWSDRFGGRFVELFSPEVLELLVMIILQYSSTTSISFTQLSFTNAKVTLCERAQETYNFSPIHERLICLTLDSHSLLPCVVVKP